MSTAIRKKMAAQGQQAPIKIGGFNSDVPKSAIEEVVLGKAPADDDGDDDLGDDSHSNDFQKKKDDSKKKKEPVIEDDNDGGDDDDGNDYSISKFIRDSKKSKKKDDDDSDDDDSKKDDKKKDEPKVDDKKKDDKKDDDDFDPESFDPESVVTASGKPVSSASKDVFKKFKATAAKRQEEINNLKKQLEEIQKKSPTESEDYKKLQEDYKKYKDIVDSKYFEESPEFAETFINPINRKYNQVGTLLTDLANDGIITEKNASIIRENLQKFDAAVKSGKRGAIYAAIAAIEDEVDGPAAKAIVKEIEEFVPLFEKYKKAVNDKEEARRLIDKETGDRVTNTLKNFNISFKAVEDDFMEKQKDRIAFLRSDHIKDIIQFDELYGAAKKEAQDAIKSFATSGEMNSKLVALLHKAALHPVNQRELETQASTIAAFHRRVNDQEEEIKALKKTISDIKKLKNKGSFRYDDDDDDDEEDDSPRSSGTSAIVQALRAQSKKR